MSVSVSSVVSAAVKDANVVIVTVTSVLAFLANVVLPLPASDQHWITGAIVAGGVFVKVLKDVVADLSTTK